MMNVIKCDKCGSTRVTDTVPPGEYRPPEALTMSEFIGRRQGPHTVHAVMIYTEHVLKCHACGHEVSYSV